MDNRIRIIEGAAELFRTYGIKSVTMDSLAGHIGMSKRTIYEVFSDKDELLIGVLNWMAEKQKELVKRVLDESENAIVAIFKLLEINRDHFQQMSPAFQADLKKFHHEVLMKKADKCEMPDYSNNLEVIEKGIKEGLYRTDVNVELVAGLYVRNLVDMHNKDYCFVENITFDQVGKIQFQILNIRRAFIGKG